MLEKEFVDIIQKISDEMGKNIFLEAKKIKSLLLDYTKSEFKKECSLLTAILDTDSVNFINRAENLADCKQFLVKRLEDDYSLSPQKSAEMLDLLFLVLRGVEIQAPASVPATRPEPQPTQITYYCVHSWQKYHADGNYSEGEDVLREEQGNVIPEKSYHNEHPVFNLREYFSTYKEARAKLDLLLKSYRDYGTRARIKLRNEVTGETITYDGVT
jgi:hypothetical protein